MTFVKDVPFMQALIAPHTLTMTSAGFLGAYIGLQNKAKKFDA